MGAAVLLLVFLVGPTVYATANPSGCIFSKMLYKFVHQIDTFVRGEVTDTLVRGETAVNVTQVKQEVTQVKRETAFRNQYFVPKSPRRPVILVWPSVMNPALSESVKEKLEEREKINETKEVQCDDQMKRAVERLTVIDVLQVLDDKGWFPENDRAPEFFADVLPTLIEWMSAETLECGFNTIFPFEQTRIHSFINKNRDAWIMLIQELAYILLQVIAVIHHQNNLFNSGPDYGHLKWIENWPEAYEHWYKTYKNSLTYIQKIIVNSLDIVVAWLFDSLGKRVRKEPIKTFLGRGDNDDWAFTNDHEVQCSLGGIADNVHVVDWYFLLNDVSNKIQAMNEAYMTCSPKNFAQCNYVEPIIIVYGTTPVGTVARTPKPLICKLKCNDIVEITGMDKKYMTFVYGHSYMTTQLGHDLYCNAQKARLLRRDSEIEVSLQCHPLVVEAYLTARHAWMCKWYHCERPCCNFTQQIACETVSASWKLTDPNFQVDNHRKMTNVTLYKSSDEQFITDMLYEHAVD